MFKHLSQRFSSKVNPFNPVKSWPSVYFLAKFDTSGQPTKRRFTRGLAQKEENEASFKNDFERVLKLVTSCEDRPELQAVNDWLHRVMLYTVPNGKLKRGIAVTSCYNILAQSLDIWPKEGPQQARTLGWAIELLQTAFLLYDDIADGSTRRRGKPCWHLEDGVNLMAYNDNILMTSSVYRLLSVNFRGLSFYPPILDLFLKVEKLTNLGQATDMMTSNGTEPKFESFTPEHYADIVKLKTSFYTFSLPVRSALYLAGIIEESVHQKAEKILLEMGHLFQVTDDVLDCFGDPSITGKVGTDIDEGKCSWLVIQALERASASVRVELMAIYGKPFLANRVKQIYNDLSLVAEFDVYQKQRKGNISALIEQISDETQLPPDLFRHLLP